MASRTFLLLALAFAVVLLITSEVAAAKELASDTDMDVEDTKAVVDVEDTITVQDVEATTMVEEGEDATMTVDVECPKVADMAAVVVDVTKKEGAVKMASRTFLLLALAFAVVLLITSEVAAAKELASDTDMEMEDTKALVDVEDTKAVVDVEGPKVADMVVVVVDVPTKKEGAGVAAHLKRQPLTSKLKTN
ncbi:hypothetical protein LXL04_038037 [Taraxacum kok-saghyz]